jgi:type IV secretory pathway VirD2 relaxase
MSYGPLAVPSKTSAFQRRAVVNVRYSSSRTPGGWKAHGTYLERESAKGDGQQKEKETGLEHDMQSTHSDRLGLAREHSLGSLADGWQHAGDERIFKVIVSPEDSMADFERISRDMITRIEQHTGAPVQWAGVVHRNTEHPHAHLLVRGRLPSGEPLKLPPALIRKGLREAVQSSLTRQLGPRTIEEIEQQKQVELTANRVTPLDRRLAGRMASYDTDPVFRDVGTSATAAELARLRHLQKLGLSKQDIVHSWLIRSDFLNQLREMKDIQDRARTLFRSGVAISDPHAPMEYSTSSKKLVGRVLLNSEDERTGALQTIFETTHGKIEIIRHDGTLRAAWSRGDLAPGNVVTIDSLRSDPEKLYAASVGKDEELLTDDRALGSIARRMRMMGLTAGDSDKGWIGQFNAVLRSRLTERLRSREY